MLQNALIFKCSVSSDPSLDTAMRPVCEGFITDGRFTGLLEFLDGLTAFFHELSAAFNEGISGIIH